MYSRESGSALSSLGSVGTRRTVYLSEEEPPATAAPSTPQAPGKSAAPLLVYNRISTPTVANSDKSKASPAPATAASSAEETPREAGSSSERKKQHDTAKENAIWYEYGCV